VAGLHTVTEVVVAAAKAGSDAPISTSAIAEAIAAEPLAPVGKVM
jgi:hypothetical protein